MIETILCLLLVGVSSAPFQRIHDYNQYLQEWQKIVPAQQIYDVSYLASNTETCYGQQCKFYYYESFATGRVDKSRNHTVLLVSGMHGNQYIGPHALLYGYQHFKAAHIIYFPIANPSGFAVNKRHTQPNQIDPNRDFPVDNNKVCYQSNAALILDYLLRKYHFDLTFILHDGMSEIGFNWGTHTHLRNSHTDDYEIQMGIAQLMKRVGGENTKLGMTGFKAGTMNEVIYPASGSLDDWAYAVGRYPSIITACDNYQYQPYPQGMASDIVFLLELGPQQTALLGSQEALGIQPGEEGDSDGYVSRAIRMIREGLKVTSPTLSIIWKADEAQITVQGCATAVLTAFDAFQNPRQEAVSESSHIFSLEQSLEIEGNARSRPPKPTIIKYRNSSPDPKKYYMSFVGSFECGREWIGKGNSSFAQTRKYVFETKGVSWRQSSQPVDNSWISLVATWWKTLTLDDLLLFGVYVMCVLAMMSAVFAILQCICRPKPKLPEKFEQTASAEEVENEEDLHTARGGIIEEQM